MKNTTMLEEIIEHCKENGITAYELAKYLPLSQVALQGILDQKTKTPRIKNIKQIHDFLFKSDIENKKITTSKNTNNYDNRIESTSIIIEEIQKNIELINETLPDVDSSKADKLKKKLEEYTEKIQILEERIEIYKTVKENHKE